METEVKIAVIEAEAASSCIYNTQVQSRKSDKYKIKFFHLLRVPNCSDLNGVTPHPCMCVQSVCVSDRGCVRAD